MTYIDILNYIPLIPPEIYCIFSKKWTVQACYGSALSAIQYTNIFWALLAGHGFRPSTKNCQVTSGICFPPDESPDGMISQWKLPFSLGLYTGKQALKIRHSQVSDHVISYQADDIWWSNPLSHKIPQVIHVFWSFFADFPIIQWAMARVSFRCAAP